MESLLHNSLAIRVFFAAIAATPSIKVTLSTIFVIIAAVSTGMHNGSTVSMNMLFTNQKKQPAPSCNYAEWLVAFMFESMAIHYFVAV